MGALDLKGYHADEILLFSDGLSTFGKEEMTLSNIPVTAISSSVSANFSYLKYIAMQTHGRFADLTKMEVNDAVSQLNNEPLQWISTEYNPGDAEEIYTSTKATIRHGFTLAGIVKKAVVTITANFCYGNNITMSKVFTIAADKASTYDNVKRIWAEMKIAQLDLRYQTNKEAITKLGKEFSIVTRNTSLLVLDRWRIMWRLRSFRRRSCRKNIMYC